MNTLDRKKFFSTIGIGALSAMLLSHLPHKLILNAVKKSGRKKINMSVHPAAVKRNEKV